MAPIFFDAYTRIGPRRRDHARARWSLHHLRDELNHCSISAALVSSEAQLQYDCMHENRALADKLSSYDHLFAIWNIMPHWSGDFPDPSLLIREMRERGIRAVTLHPRTNLWDVRSRTSLPLLEALAEQQTLAIINAPAEVSALDIEWLAVQFPQWPLLLRGMTWSQAHQILPLVRNFSSIHIAFDTFQINRGIEFLAGLGLANQLVFCSNAPQMSAGAHRAYVDWAEIDDAAKAMIAGGNLTRLLGGLAPPREYVNADEDAIMTACRHGRPLPCLTIDMHAHVLDEGLQAGDAAYPMLEGGPAGLQHQAERVGIDAVGVMSWNGTVGVQARDGNACVHAALDVAPDKFWGLGTFDVVRDEPETNHGLMQQLFEDPRFLGLKPYPSYGVPYHDNRFDVWWQFGQARRLYAGFHPVQWYQRDEFASVCERFPDLTVVAYHAGANFEIADTVIALTQEFDNLMMEPTYTSVCGGIIEYLVEHAGANRLMFGSDQPMRDARQQLGWIVFSHLSVAEKHRVLGLNAMEMLLRNGQIHRQSPRGRSIRAMLLSLREHDHHE